MKDQQRAYLIFSFSLFFLFITISPVIANPVKQFFEKGMIAYGQKRYNAAISAYEEALKLYPKFAPGYYYIGLSHKAKGSNLDVLQDYFLKTVEIDPNHAQAHEELSKIFYALGEFDQAEFHGAKSVELKPDSISAQLSLAWVYLLGTSKPREAINHFEYVIEKQDIPYAQFGLGIAYFMDEQKFRVLEMITALRSIGQEDFAGQLENMVKHGYYIPPRGGRSLMGSPRKKPVFNDDFSNQYPELYESGKVEVRLRKSTTPDVSKQVTGAQRIRELQNNTKPPRKGSGY